MADTDPYGDGTDPLEETVATPERLGAVATVIDVGVFTYVGSLLFGDPIFGAGVGLLVGVGTYLFLPYFLYAELLEDFEAELESRAGAPARGFHRTAGGIALAAGGIVLLAWRIASSDVLAGAGVLLVVVAVLYAVLSRTMPRPPF